MDADLLDRDEKILRDQVDVAVLPQHQPAGRGRRGAVIGERGGGETQEAAIGKAARIHRGRMPFRARNGKGDSPATVPTRSGFLGKRALGLGDDRLERLALVHRDIGEDLAVQLDAGELERRA